MQVITAHALAARTWRATFAALWLGQTLSQVGSTLASFAFGVWVYHRTGSATAVSLIALCNALPGLVVAPLSGAIVDRHDRRRVLLISDAAALAIAIGLGALYWRGALEIAVLCAAVGAASLLASLRQPAYQALVASVASPAQLGRVSGMLQLSGAVSELIGPLLGGVAVLALGLGGVIALDVASFGLAIAGYAIARRGLTDAGVVAADLPRAGLRGLARDVAAAWRYLRGFRGTVTLIAAYAAWNFAIGVVTVLATPLLLSFAGPRGAGMALSVGGVAMVLATVMMSAWGGPRRPIRWILAINPIIGLAIAAASLRASLPWFLVAIFIAYFAMQTTAAAAHAFWLRVVAPAMRGRVFALRRMIPLSTLPLAYALAGPLADHVFEPALQPGGALASSVGAVIGTGPGRGIACLYLLAGLLFVVTAAIAATSRGLRELDALASPSTGAAPAPADAP